MIKSKLKIHLSGIDNDLKIELRDKIEQLKGSIDENLTFYTKILICNDVNNPKYKVNAGNPDGSTDEH